MTITYHSGRRIQATQADFDGTPAVSGGWKELGRTSNSSLPDVTSLADKRYLMFLNFQESNASRPVVSMRINGDTGSNYALRGSGNGLTDYTSINKTSLQTIGGQPQGDTTTVPYFTVGYIANLAGKEKLGQRLWAMQMTAGAGTAPDRAEIAYKWSNTSDAINRIDMAVGSGTLDSGSEMVVLGYDPDDTHTDNFWEQLADVSLSSASDTLSSGTINSKKYLWVQYYTKNSGNVETKCRFNSDSGSNYAFRWSEDGGSDVTYTSQTECDRWIFASKPSFRNFFIINNASNEKLITGHVMSPNTAGAGTAPSRAEFASKWTNTSDQITNITVNNTGSGDMDSGSFIKVWGSN